MQLFDSEFRLPNGVDMPSDTRPYFVPSADVVGWSPWLLLSGGGWVELPASVDGWHPGIDLKVAREFHIDIERLERETGCVSSELMVTLRWISSTTQMLGSVDPILVPATGSGRLEAILPGDRIGGVLTLRAAIVFAGSDGGGQLGAARIPGSVLTDHSHAIALERDSRMFPMQMVDFARTPYSPEASWHLEIDGDLETPYLSGFMLLINSRDKALRDAIEQEAKGETELLLFGGLEEQVAQLLLTLAIESRDEVLAGEWPLDSVGDVLTRTLLHSGLDASALADMPSADRQTAIAGAVRQAGHGRLFR
jgi:hypothetical protein